MSAREIERVLAEHRLTTPVQCVCGWRETDGDVGTHPEHQADALLPFLAEREAAARGEALREARGYITQYVSTAEKWRYDRVCWAFGIMLGEIPADTPEPLSPADDRLAALDTAADRAEGAT